MKDGHRVILPSDYPASVLSSPSVFSVRPLVRRLRRQQVVEALLHVRLHSYDGHVVRCEEGCGAASVGDVERELQKDCNPRRPRLQGHIFTMLHWIFVFVWGAQLLE